MNIEKAKAELWATMAGPAGKNWGYGPAVKTLLDELERKEEQRANWFQMVEKLGADLDAAERRIVELSKLLADLQKGKPGGVYFNKWDAQISHVLQSTGISNGEAPQGA